MNNNNTNKNFQILLCDLKTVLFCLFFLEKDFKDEEKTSSCLRPHFPWLLVSVKLVRWNKGISSQLLAIRILFATSSGNKL